jgi:hypothetical protein
VTNRYLQGFGLAHDGGERFDSITPVLHDGIVVSRAIYAPKDTSYLRYFDTFLNSTGEPRTVRIAWGGATGAFDDGGRVAVATTSSGDRRHRSPRPVRHRDAERARRHEPGAGPLGHGPSAHVLGTKARGPHGRWRHVRGSVRGDLPWLRPGAHRLRLRRCGWRPDRPRRSMTFVVKGLSEVYDPRGGYPIARTDALLSNWSDPVYTVPTRACPRPVPRSRA